MSTFVHSAAGPTAEAEAPHSPPLNDGPAPPRCVPGAEFVDASDTRKRRKKSGKASRQLQQDGALADSARADVAPASAWWERVNAEDKAAYEPAGFAKMALPTSFTALHNGSGTTAAATHTAEVALSSPSTSPSTSFPHTFEPCVSEEASLDPLPLQVAPPAEYPAPFSLCLPSPPDASDPDAMFAQLLDMGYEEEDARDVAFRCTSIAAAVEALSTRTDPELVRALQAAELAQQAHQAAAAAAAAAARAERASVNKAEAPAGQVLCWPGAQTVQGSQGSRAAAKAASGDWVTVPKKSSALAKAAAASALHASTAEVLHRLIVKGLIKPRDLEPRAVQSLAEAPVQVAFEVVQRLEWVLNKGSSIHHVSQWIKSGVAACAASPKYNYKFGFDDPGGSDYSDDDEDDESLTDGTSSAGYSTTSTAVMTGPISTLEPDVQEAVFLMLRKVSARAQDLDQPVCNMLAKLDVANAVALLSNVRPTPYGGPISNISAFLVNQLKAWGPNRRIVTPPQPAYEPAAVTAYDAFGQGYSGQDMVVREPSRTAVHQCLPTANPWAEGAVPAAPAPAEDVALPKWLTQQQETLAYSAPPPLPPLPPLPPPLPSPLVSHGFAGAPVTDEEEDDDLKYMLSQMHVA